MVQSKKHTSTFRSFAFGALRGTSNFCRASRGTYTKSCTTSRWTYTNSCTTSRGKLLISGWARWENSVEHIYGEGMGERENSTFYIHRDNHTNLCRASSWETMLSSFNSCLPAFIETVPSVMFHCLFMFIFFQLRKLFTFFWMPQ